MEITSVSGLIQEKTFDFALSVIAFGTVLTERKKFVLANQIIRCGTSVGANVREAQHAESRADFIHKLKIASKEAEETSYFLELCEKAADYPKPGELLTKSREIQRILSKIIASSKTVLRG